MPLLTHKRLAQLVARFGSKRIAVVGDFFLDKYLDTDPALAETSVESGKRANQVVGIRVSPGAAGTVTANLAALGAGELHAIGFTGDDGEGYDLRKSLAAIGCTTTHLHMSPSRHTPQYLKPRNMCDRSLAGEHERYDTKNRTPTPAELERKLIASIDVMLPKIDALVVMDQVEEDGCGVITSSVREMICQRAKAMKNVIFWADSRRRIGQFRNVIIKPNQFEAIGAQTWGPSDEVPLDTLRQAVAKLREQNSAAVFATRGTKGMVVSDPWTIVPAVRVDGPTDPTGAGDSVSAGAVLALCAHATAPEAAVIGNLVASITVQQLGTTGTASPTQLPGRLSAWLEQQSAI